MCIHNIKVRYLLGTQRKLWSKFQRKQVWHWKSNVWIMKKKEKLLWIWNWNKLIFLKTIPSYTNLTICLKSSFSCNPIGPSFGLYVIHFLTGSTFTNSYLLTYITLTWDWPIIVQGKKQNVFLGLKIMCLFDLSCLTFWIFLTSLPSDQDRNYISTDSFFFFFFL